MIHRPNGRGAGGPSGLAPSTSYGSRLAGQRGSNIVKVNGTNMITSPEGMSPMPVQASGPYYKGHTSSVASGNEPNNIHQGGLPKGRVKLQGGSGTTPYSVEK